MGIKSKSIVLSLLVFTALSFSATSAVAENVFMNTAKMQALDKITGQMKEIDVPVNGEVKFGSFSIIVRNCQTTPPEEIPENYAFVDVADTDRNGKSSNIFKGWMVSSSPSLNSVEHPIYDVWLLKCINTQIAPTTLLSAQQLEERDRLEKYQEHNLSKEAKIALEVQEEQARQAELTKAEEEEQIRIQEEVKEAEARQKELEKEIQAQQNEANQEIPASINDGEGPVSLLAIGQQNAPQNIVIEEPDNTSAEVSDTSETTTESLPSVDNIILEDTHHENINQDLNLPADIDEIMPDIKTDI